MKLIAYTKVRERLLDWIEEWGNEDTNRLALSKIYLCVLRIIDEAKCKLKKIKIKIKKIVFEFVSSKFKCTVKDIEKEVKPCYDAQTHCRSLMRSCYHVICLWDEMRLILGKMFLSR